jgi:hypothetical protein
MMGKIRRSCFLGVLSCVTACAGQGPSRSDRGMGAAGPRPVGPWHDCFAEAAKVHVADLRLESPATVLWDTGSEEGGKLPLVLRNVTGRAGIVNNTGSWYMVAGGVSLSFATLDGRPWVDRSGFKTIFEPDVFPKRGDYVKLGPGESVEIPQPLNSGLYRVPRGEYTIHVCYWDEYEDAHLFGEGLPVLRGPVVAPVVRLTVK